MGLLERLQGGDLRSIGRVDEVVQIVGDDPERFAELMTGLTDDRPVVRYPRFHDELIDLLHKQLETGSPAVRSRCNTLLVKWRESE
ncbi:hypothetical protein EVJ32_03195 [Exiguobacterium sp. SH5S4]|uniref:hypothetical protein n=1 Tax=Exiguobacterium sp. SH5S4 TaxID=2510961 RepID=UPI0010397553|nr:hypothetical protein [Exiguobacterium sp. SH5S4]TCI27212.1 hypothetical protein EVJ32_03195 [Exiguobacterium sp. SH5S4]